MLNYQRVFFIVAWLRLNLSGIPSAHQFLMNISILRRENGDLNVDKGVVRLAFLSQTALDSGISHVFSTSVDISEIGDLCPWRIHGAAIIYGNIYHQYIPNVSIYIYIPAPWIRHGMEMDGDLTCPSLKRTMHPATSARWRRFASLEKSQSPWLSLSQPWRQI